MCFRIDLTSSVAVWRPSGVVQGLQTPPGTPDGVWRPSGVKSSLQALRGLKVSGGPARPLRTFGHLQTPQIESAGPQGSPRASTHLQAPQNRVWRPSGVAQGPQGCWGGAPGGNRETVFLSPPLRGQPRNSVSVTPRSPFSVMGDRRSSVGGEERSLSVGGELGKKCNMLIYPSRYRRGTPRECVLELI